MNPVKFISNDVRQRQFAVALRKNVHEYFKTNGISSKGNTAMFVKTAILAAIYIVPFILVLTIPMSGISALLLMVVMGIGMAGTGMSVMHDAVHGAYSNKKWVNTLIGGSIYLIGSSKVTWAIQHNYLHHTFTNITGYDQDIDTKGFIRLSRNAKWRRYMRFQAYYALFFYGFMTLAKLIADVPQLLKYNRVGLTKDRKEKPSAEIIRMIFSKSIYLVLVFGLPIWLTAFTWWQIMIGFLVMHMTGGMIMSVIFQMAHVVEGADQPMPDENGIIHNEWVVHELNTTSDFAQNNAVLNWYAGGLNFQIEHHLFPNVCHIHYGKIAPIVQRTAAEYGIRYMIKPTFREAFISHMRMLSKLGREPQKKNPADETPTINNKTYEEKKVA